MSFNSMMKNTTQGDSWVAVVTGRSPLYSALPKGIGRRQGGEPTGGMWPADGRRADRVLTSATASMCSLLSQRRLCDNALKSLQHTGGRSPERACLITLIGVDKTKWTQHSSTQQPSQNWTWTAWDAQACSHLVFLFV